MSDLPFSYFKRLPDRELIYPFATFERTDSNVANANREVRRRAKVAGYDDVYDWLFKEVRR